jgi:sugar lactone lactonase YvrE
MKISLRFLPLLSIFAFCGLSIPKAEAMLLIGNSASNNIVLFDEITGSFLGNFTTPGNGGLIDPDDLTFGPNGVLYVSVGGNSGLNLLDPTYPQNSAVLRFSRSGEFLGVAASGNGLTRPYGTAIGPDGYLYVASFRTNQILRFNPQTGAFIDVFASDNNGGLGSPNGLNGPNGLLFGPDGSLYVTTEGTANDVNGNLVFSYPSQVLRYTPQQVAGTIPSTTPTVFANQPTPLPDTFGFVSLLGLALAPDGQSIYVSDFAGGVRQYSLTGTLLNTISTNYTGTNPSNNFIGGLTFGTGATSSNLYTIGFNFTNNNIGSVLQLTNAQGSATTYTGTTYTSSSLVRPIGVTAAPVPEPSTVAGLLLATGGLGMSRLRKRRSEGVRG